MSRPGKLPANSEYGFTLIELMVALVLGLLLLGGVLQLFLGSKKTYELQATLGRVQQESRFALETLSRELRMIGYQGCSNSATLSPNVIADSDGDDVPDIVFTPDLILDGFDGGSGWSNPTAIPTQAGSDVIRFLYGDSNSARLAGNMASDNANIQVTHNPDNFTAGDILLVTDCQNADIFAATTVSQSGGNSIVTIAHAENRNTSNRLSQLYGPDAMVMRIRQHSYFIGIEDGAPGLYRSDEGGNVFRLIEGVEDMYVLYGESTDGSNTREANRYVRADEINDWSRIVALRLALLLRTDRELADAPEPYDYRYFSNNNPNDRFLRRELVISVNLRNRMP